MPPKPKKRQPRSATKAARPAPKAATTAPTTITATASRSPSTRKRKRPATTDPPAAPASIIRPKRARKQAPAPPAAHAVSDDDAPPDEISDLDDPEFSSTPATTKPSRPRKGQNAPASTPRQASLSPAPEPGTKAIRDAIPIDHPHLAPRLRRIPRAVIAAKWSPLDASSLATIKSTLNLTAQPALLRTGTNAARHAAGLAVVKAVTKRVMGKLSRGLPFPPASAGGVPRGKSSTEGGQRARGADGGRADELDYERTVGGVRALEETLDTLLHSVAILERERAGLEADVEREHGRVVKLEGDVRREAAMWKENLRKTHPLTPADSNASSGTTKALQRRHGLQVQQDDDGRGMAFRGLGGEDADEHEEEVRDLARQVASHMDSIKTNMAQIDGVVSGIETTRAALQAVLARNVQTQSQLEGERVISRV